MNLINKASVEKFAQWAEQHENKNAFPTISSEEDSYYIDRDGDETYIMEYSFENLEEFKKLLERYSGLPADSEMLQMLVIEACANRYRCGMEMNVKCEGKLEPHGENKNTLPEYVYVF